MGWKLRPVPSSSLVLCAGVWLPAQGSVQLLLSRLAVRTSIGSAAAPLPAQGGAEEARLSLLPLHCLEAHGKWEEISLPVLVRGGGDLLGKAALELLAPG